MLPNVHLTSIPPLPVFDPVASKRSFLIGLLEKAVRGGRPSEDLYNTISRASDVYDQIKKGLHD